MRDASRRPWGRFSCWVVALVLSLIVAGKSARATPSAYAAPQTSGMTAISDTVYMADGTPAQGTLLITWPAFVTASETAVAGGNTSVTLGAGGALTVQLEPTPAGVYYTVVYQLGPSEMKTQYWVVPVSTTPVNLATVITTPGSGAAAQPVSMQYVNSALATKANDNAVVHLANPETITGVKSFTVNPNVPAPVNPGDVANKSYVDSSVSNVGSGTYLPTAGGTLPANPASAMQASTKQYVDTSAAAKANLVSGLVPANELGTGLSNSGSCLLGNGASAVWGACGGGTGTGNISTTPAASQAIAQPEGTQFSANNLANIRYVTGSWNWAQTPSDNLATPGSLTIHLAPCSLGLDTNSRANYYSYKVYISGTGTPEAVPVTGGTCTPGSSSGTITVTTAYAHAAGYTVGSASTGIQEAWNDAWVNDIPTTPNASTDTGPYVKLAANTQYDIYATVFLRGVGGTLDGTSALIVSHTRDRAIFVGTLQAEPYIAYHKIYNLTAATPVAVDGAQVASVSATSGTYTVTTAGAHPFVAGDTVDCEYHSQTTDQHWMSKVLATGLSATTFQVSFGSRTFAAGANTFGFCNIENAFIEDGSDHVDIENLQIVQAWPSVGTGYFNYGVVNDNDQQLQIERAANRGQGSINPNSAHFTATWPIGAFFYGRTDQGNAGITYIHKSEFSSVNCASAGGNGFAADDTVCQGFPIFGFRYFGGLQPATFTNVYQEACPACYNALYTGGNYAAQMGYLVQGSQPVRVVGTWPTQGETPVFATGGGSAAERTYFVVPRSSAFGYGPVLFAGSAEPASASVNVNVLWPSVDLVNATGSSVGTLTWDVLVTTGVGTPAPWGSGMYAIATNVSGNCGTNGMCSFTDTQAAPTAYTVQAQRFTPSFWFWPVNYAINNSILQVDQIGSDPQSVATQGTTGASIIAQQCYSGGVSQRRTPMEVSCLQVQTPGAYVQATLLRQTDASGNGPSANSKGRLNFGKSIVAPNDLVTLVDSNVIKTTATSGERPSGDAGDLALGIDQSGGLAQRAANSISSYINVLPNGTNFLERLTASGKTVNVPLTVNGSLAVTSGTVTLPVTGSGNQCLHVSSAGVLSGTGADCGSGGGSGSVTVNTGVTSELALYSGNGPSSGTVATTASPTFTGTLTEPDGTRNASSGYSFAHALTLPNGSVATTQAAGDNSAKVATTAYVRGEQYMTYMCPVATVSTAEQFCTWTLPAGVTVTGYDLSAGQAPAGCTTSAVIQVWDGTANAEVGSFSIALSNGNNFYTQVTGSTSVASGHALRIKTTTAEAGCTTTAGNVVAIVTYQMQN